MSRFPGAMLRAVLVAVVVALPALMLPDVSSETGQLVTLLALVACAVTLAEYSAACPGLVEFRDARPYNRMRFILLFFLILFLTILVRNDAVPTPLSVMITSGALWLGTVFDFAYSPIRLLSLALPAGLPAAHLDLVRGAAALGYVIGWLSVLGLMVAILVGYWPQRRGAFNVWVNLPTFDPTAGLDVVQRLERDALVNIALGILMPFFLPVILKLSSLLIQPVTLESPLGFVWGIALWAFVPVSLLMRGIAMQQVARLIRDKRREVAAEEDGIPQPERSVYS